VKQNNIATSCDLPTDQPDTLASNPVGNNHSATNTYTEQYTEQLLPLPIGTWATKETITLVVILPWSRYVRVRG